MFTGIVTHCAPIKSCTLENGLLRLVVTTSQGFTDGLEKGASISVNGVCLTVVAWDDESATFDVIDETLRLTNLGGLNTGDTVNLERAARFGDEIGGHPLSGHIHTQAKVVQWLRQDGNAALQLEIDSRFEKYIISKGYIAINGCSLTIGEVNESTFWLHLIPETLAVTNIQNATPGNELNVEIDHQTQVIVDTIGRYMQQHNP